MHYEGKSAECGVSLRSTQITTFLFLIFHSSNLLHNRFYVFCLHSIARQKTVVFTGMYNNERMIRFSSLPDLLYRNEKYYEYQT